MAKIKLPSPITILMIVIIIAAFCTWLVPAGKYNTLANNKNKNFTLTTTDTTKSLAFTQAVLDSLHLQINIEKFENGDIKKPISIPGTYKKIAANKQGILEIIQAPLKGIYDSVDIIFFILVIGSFMQIFSLTGAMEQGLASLSNKMNGQETWLIVVLTFLFSFAGASYGMAEEALVFYAVLVPIFLKAGYDLIVPVAVIFGGTQLGTLASFSNPFSSIIASNAAGINWKDGITERLIMFALTTIITIWYIVKYAKKVKQNPSSSYAYLETKADQNNILATNNDTNYQILSNKAIAQLLIFLATFLTMIVGVIWLNWWLLEMSTLFIVAAVLVAIINKINEKTFITEFVKGAEALLSVAFIVGVARGVTIMLNQGNISDTIVFYAAQAVSTMPAWLFIISIFLLFIVFTLFISSSSGMAVLTMPIMGSLAMLVHVPGREIVNAYLFGMGIMGFITPTGLILPSLAIVNVSIKAWLKFITPLLLILILVCIACLLIGINLQ